MSPGAPLLLVLSGRPGSGKTTLARGVCRRTGAVHLRIDTLEQAIRGWLPAGAEVGPSGYAAAMGVARDNLALGLPVVADCVNPVAASRAGWHGVAASAGARCLDVLVLCSDAQAHRRRVETRDNDIAGLVPPTFAMIEALDFEPPAPEVPRIDTGLLTPEDALAQLLAIIDLP